MLDPRLTTPLLISLAMLIFFALMALAIAGVPGLIVTVSLVGALAVFVRAWTGKDDPPDPPKALAGEKAAA